MRSRDPDIIMVPGLGGSGLDHWQSRWQAKLPNALRAEQADWDAPRLDAWVGTLRAAIAQCTRPVVLIAHSLGVATVVHATQRPNAPPLAGAFLVAPPSDTAIGAIEAIDRAFLPTPRATLSFPAMVVGSRNDPYASIEDSAALAAAWGAALLDAGEAGHINTESGHGPWPEGLMAFAGFLNGL